MGGYKYSYTLPGTDIVVHSDIPQSQQSSSVMSSTPVSNSSSYSGSNKSNNSNNNNVQYGGLVTDKYGNTTRSYTENNRYGQQSGTVLPGSVLDPNSQNYDSDYAHGLAENVNGQKVFYDSNGNLPTAAQALKDSIANNRVYSSTPDRNSGGGNSVSSSYSPTSTSYSTPSYVSNNYYSGYNSNANNIDTLYAQKLSAAQAALKDAIAQSKAQYQTTIDQAPQQFYDSKNQITADAAKNGQNLRELLANNGEQGGVNRTEQTALNASTENKLNAVNLAQQKVVSDAQTAINNLIASGQTQEAQLVAQNAAEKIQALINQSNTDRGYSLQENAQNNQVNQFNQSYALQQQQIQNALAQQATDNALKQKQLEATLAQQKIENDRAAAAAAEQNARWAEEYHNSKDQAALNREQNASQFDQEYGLKLQQLAQQAAAQAATQQKASNTTAAKQEITDAKNNAYNNLYALLNSDVQLAREWLTDNQEALINTLGATEYNKMRDLYLQKAKQG